VFLLTNELKEGVWLADWVRHWEKHRELRGVLQHSAAGLASATHHISEHNIGCWLYVQDRATWRQYDQQNGPLHRLGLARLVRAKLGTE
jgi:hypothetical protein